MINDIIDTHIKNIQDILINSGERVEGNLICDVYGDNYVIDRNYEKIHNIQVLSCNKSKICEVGVNAGHSLLLMVYNNPTAEYILFDDCYHGYTKLCLNYIKSQFPETKITLIEGNSMITIPRYISDNPAELSTFGLVHIDGGHGTDVVMSDFENGLKLVSESGITIFDDYDYSNIREVLDYYLSNGDIVKYIDSNIIDTRLHLIYSKKKI
jgi:hypothetical protein